MTNRGSRVQVMARAVLLVALLATAGPGAAQTVWVRKAQMPTPRVTLCTAVVDGRIYAIGGGGYVMEADAEVEAYDPVTDTWARKADMPTARGFLAAAVAGGKIYAIGGEGWAGDWLAPRAAPMGTVEVYDPGTDTWSLRASMPTPRSELGASVLDGRIYAIGGLLSEDRRSSAVEMYDPASDTWTPKAPLPGGPRVGLSTCVADGKIYAIGGADLTSTMVTTVEAYDPATDTWTRKADLPTPMGWMGADAVDGRIFAAGGIVLFDGSPDYVGALNPGRVFVYDPASDAWTQETDLPEPRVAPAASAVGGKLYVVGGASVYELPATGAMVLTPSVEVLEPCHRELLRRLQPTAVAVATGQGVSLSVNVELAAPTEEGTYPGLALDLSRLGDSALVPFTHAGEGHYGALAPFAPAVPGQFALPIWLDPEGPATAVLDFVRLSVYPGADLPLYADGPAPGWTWRAVAGATVDVMARSPAPPARSALAIQGTGRTWRVTGTSPAPVSSFGYEELHLELLPAATAPSALEIGLNSHGREDLLRRVNWADKSWQHVAIPLDSLGLEPEEAIAAVYLTAVDLKDTVYLDQVKLVPTAPPPCECITAVEESRTPSRPAGFALAQNYPNPFNSSTVIRFTLPAASAVELAVYNLAGQRVASLARGAREAGAYTVCWDGRDDRGRRLASGAYLCRLQAGSQKETRKLLLLR